MIKGFTVLFPDGTERKIDVKEGEEAFFKVEKCIGSNGSSFTTYQAFVVADVAIKE